MKLVTGAVRSYPWGSRTLIPAMRGDGPSQSPVAEVWFGAHPGAPATVDGTALNDLIAADPVAALGEKAVAAHGPRLPYLLKLLAAAEPLSLQAHPSKAQAEAGCAAEDEAGIARDADNRNYRDDNHKPETLVALTPFEAFAGFRPIAATGELFTALNCRELAQYTGMLAGDGTSPVDPDTALRALFTTWIALPAATRTTLVDAVTRAAQAYLDSHGPDDQPWIADVLATIVAVAERYPGDVGVLGALLLNKVNLAPGEGVFLGAGNLHSYISGLGVEIMANSDNVLRGGLTSKHVDVPELVKVLSFDPLADPRITTIGNGRQTDYDIPAAEFTLTRHECTTSGQPLAASGPRIALCTSATVTLQRVRDNQTLVLHPTQAAWIPDSDGPVNATGTGQLFLAGC
ncbi:mannose-6-phosphate isomerase, class I [Corynebacterium mendelii]|uniref:mannose-6-phosphate isomerase n=1 Tax=Corynebacterium mendelii TaxID=2765362 RepID=A0A939E2G4_9CORY|nr:mannose-6-phosphate isomerase, class I [Corynebacterium mendelii]MBN9644476.1 mannose-6-phosphate isomerase, class I [Corynebacterium mendelii]